MSIETDSLQVSGVHVSVVRKPIKNLHLGVYPPDGHVRVAAPMLVSNAAVRVAVIGKLGWIKRQQARFKQQPRESTREMVSGESHYFLGKRYRLRIVPDGWRAATVVKSKSILALHVRSDASVEQRQRALHRWYRQQLKLLIPAMVEKWEPILGVQVSAWGVKKMRTKWGACNAERGRIWLNLELAKKRVTCLEYVVVHEIAHLVERLHNDRFVALMDAYLPHWRERRSELADGPLGM